MKTTDGFELKKFASCYSRNGEMFTLTNWATDSDGSSLFFGYRTLEGEAMEAFNIDGYTEVTIGYEHECEIETFTEAFHDMPMLFIHKDVASINREIAELNLKKAQRKEALLKSEISLLELTSKLQAVKDLIISEDEIYSNVSNNLEIATEELAEVNKKLKVQTATLGYDSTSDEGVAKISDSSLKRLVEVDLKMNALIAAGVDNWEGYDIAMDEFNN